ncbi:ADP-ribosylglycohydrolase family protein [Sulfurimonas sp. MAG313]|nr:ADP-ribosylglycohydrolase family protein [Sulfurimonas sp. MAG313]MDF1881712.1 ADP-ribosylglycohydrolase family protein [Sulfurimonas sp. MAG313]
MKSSVYGAIYGALVGDAFSLGGHWVYEVAQIKEKFPTLEGFYDPMTQYHGPKKAGDFTHYGDQCMWLLESIALEKEFSLASFSTRWKEYMSDYQGYIDGASKACLENLKAGKSAMESGSSSQDLSVVGRIAPLALLFCDEQKSFEDSAVLQTKMTHNSVESINATRFFSQLLYLVFQGYTPKNSILAMLEESHDDKLKAWMKAALASTEHDSVESINACGQSCNVNGACPSSLHLILKYENNYEEAMRQNVYAGGDSAARGMVVGMILGAYNGLDKIPKPWREALSSKDRLEEYMSMACDGK